MHLILFVFAAMVEEKIPKTKVQSEQLSDSDTPDEEQIHDFVHQKRKESTGQ